MDPHFKRVEIATVDNDLGGPIRDQYAWIFDIREGDRPREPDPCNRPVRQRLCHTPQRVHLARHLTEWVLDLVGDSVAVDRFPSVRCTEAPDTPTFHFHDHDSEFRMTDHDVSLAVGRLGPGLLLEPGGIGVDDKWPLQLPLQLLRQTRFRKGRVAHTATLVATRKGVTRETDALHATSATHQTDRRTSGPTD